MTEKNIIFKITIALNILLAIFVGFLYMERKNEYKIEEPLVLPTNSFSIKDYNIEQQINSLHIEITTTLTEEMKPYIGLGTFKESCSLQFQFYGFGDTVLYASEPCVWDLQNPEYTIAVDIDQNNLSWEEKNRILQYFDHTLSSGMFGKIVVYREGDVDNPIVLEAYYSDYSGTIG